jgi:hypothetical protein
MPPKDTKKAEKAEKAKKLQKKKRLEGETAVEVEPQLLKKRKGEEAEEGAGMKSKGRARVKKTVLADDNDSLDSLDTTARIAGMIFVTIILMLL